MIPEHVSQEGLYERTGLRDMVASVLSGINVSVIAYGQTGKLTSLFHIHTHTQSPLLWPLNSFALVIGSGKTHTMEGPDEDMGVVCRAISQVFCELDEVSPKYK